MEYYRSTCATPLGMLELLVTADGKLHRIELPGSSTASPQTQLSAPPAAKATLAATVAQLQQYFAGQRLEFSLPLAPCGTPFQQSAWAVLRTIPYGQTLSYAAQAERVGRPKSARAVGAANGRNPLPIVVPCHRVIGKNGALVGFGGGLPAKQWLLQHERQVLAATLALAAAHG